MKKVVLALMVAAGLTACGGSDKAPAPKNDANVAGNTGGVNAGHAGGNNTAGNTAGNTNAGNGAKTELLAYVFDTQNQNNLQQVKDSSLKHIVIAGKRFDFHKVNQSVGQTFKGDEKEGLVVSDAAWLKHVRVGVGVPNGQDGVNFIVGEVSKELPAAGAAQYVGHGILMAKHSDGFDAVSFAANVDFGGKTVRGKLGEISFDAKFSREGARFKGGGVHGAFFGADASEMAGVYENADKSGFFGAKKQ